jgi:hypothetical protein
VLEADSEPTAQRLVEAVFKICAFTPQLAAAERSTPPPHLSAPDARYTSEQYRLAAERQLGRLVYQASSPALKMEGDRLLRPFSLRDGAALEEHGRRASWQARHDPRLILTLVVGPCEKCSIWNCERWITKDWIELPLGEPVGEQARVRQRTPMFGGARARAAPYPSGQAAIEARANRPASVASPA